MASKRKQKYGTTMHDDEKRRSRIYLICGLIILTCIILDVVFLLGIFAR